jgi:translation initiation factor IF-2
MAKIRAYKLAEELGIDRHDFVEKASEAGIELKSAMASLEEEQVAALREKFGQAAKSEKQMVESRVARKDGVTVLRRRKRQQVEEPELEAVPEPVLAEEAELELESPEEVEAELEASDEEDLEAVVEPVEEVAATELEGEAKEEAKGAPGEGLKESKPAETAETSADRKSPSPPKPDSAQPAGDRKGRQRKRVREVVNLQEQEKFARQITGRSGTTRRPSDMAPRTIVNPRRKRRDKLAVAAVAKPAAEQKRLLKVEHEISVGELARQLGAKAPAVQGKLMALGIMVSINQTVDVDVASKLAAEYGFEVQNVGFNEQDFLSPPEPEADVEAEAGEEGSFESRSPIITVMGHVDHGKTSLLDAIRKARQKVVDAEAGGITQHIGAYQVKLGDRELTFIDTPGHAAFTAMRARGAAVTDIVVLVIAATDGVMPQTVEAIEHAQAAGCPIVVAINKIDLSDADLEKTKQRLTEHNLVPEDFGGDVICVGVSAKTGEGIDHLLEMLSLQTELLELKADASRRARGVVLEARLDKGRGSVATCLIQDGTLRRGDVLVAEKESGRVRMMENDLGQRVAQAGPSVPVQVQGLSGLPSAGAVFHVVENDRVAKQILSHREDRERGQTPQASPKLTLEEFFAQAESEAAKELPLVFKADVQGTCEAIRDSLEQLSTDEVKLKILSAGVGAISESDVMLASASNAIILGFHVRPDPVARKAADGHGVEIRTYTIIMELLDEVRTAMAGLLPPVRRENLVGQAEVRQTFTIPRVGTIAGSIIMEGKAIRNSHCRLVRDGIQVYEGRIGSLRRFKEDVSEVSNGTECGIGISNFNDLKIGDQIEFFEVEEVPATL